MKELVVLSVQEKIAIPDNWADYHYAETDINPRRWSSPNAESIASDVIVHEVVLPIWRLARMENGKMTEYNYIVKDRLINQAWTADREERRKLFDQWFEMFQRVNKASFWKRLKYLFTGRLDKREE